MINPEVAEALAEFENRLSSLERLHELSNNPAEPLEERVARLETQRGVLRNTPIPRDDLEQLRARVLWLEGKVNEHIDRSKKKRGF